MQRRRHRAPPEPTSDHQRSAFRWHGHDQPEWVHVASRVSARELEQLSRLELLDLLAYRACFARQHDSTWRFSIPFSRQALGTELELVELPLARELESAESHALGLGDVTDEVECGGRIDERVRHLPIVVRCRGVARER